MQFIRLITWLVRKGMSRMVVLLFLLSSLELAHAQSNMFVCQGVSAHTLDVHSVGDMLFFDEGERLKIGNHIYSTSDIDSICFQYPGFLDQNPMTESSTNYQKRVALLDISAANNEDEAARRNVYSADYMLELAGVPYLTTSSLSDALNRADMIIISSEVKKSSFSLAQIDSLKKWVEDGGVLVSPAPSVVGTSNGVSEALSQLYGLNDILKNKSRYQLIWDERHYNDKELEYIDEPEERTISLGRGKKLSGESIKTFALTTASDDVDILARFDSGENAVTRYPLGKGCVYTFGLLWRDIVQRSQLNKDFEAQRLSSNAFEPSADVVAFFLRSTYAKKQSLAVWKFTIPDGYESLLIPTHDCDSRTAYDNMFYMSQYEKEQGLRAHYFLTTHYFRDPNYMSAFFDNNGILHSKELLKDGHTIGSHSVSHFPDFSITDRFPIKEVTYEEYAKTAHHVVDSTSTGTTTGGSTWAEVVMSKQIIEEDLNNHVRSFRTGHLCMNKNIPLAEQMGEYSFASCYSACEVLSEFPFRERLDNDWSGEFNGVLEMPLHISDVFHKDPINKNNWMEKPAVWKEVAEKLHGNYAPSILLIHPNAEWKMEVEREFVDMLDLSRVGLYNFEDYGDFWNSRRDIDFDYAYDADNRTVNIRILGNVSKETLSHQSFAIDLPDSNTKLQRIQFTNSKGECIGHGIYRHITDMRILVTL